VVRCHYAAGRLYQFPMGVLGVSLSTAIFPLLTRYVARGEAQGLRDTLTRLSFEGTTNNYPLWTPDGKRVAYRSQKGGPANLFWKPADGSAAEERLTTSEYLQTPLAFSPDGRTLIYNEQNPKTAFDLMALTLEGERKSRPVLQTPFDERAARFSPDGRWLAYNSLESGRFEVYVQPFPGPGLGVRILGEVKTEYAELLRRADAIFIEELRKTPVNAMAGEGLVEEPARTWYDATAQAFAVFLPVRSVGVMGDGRTYEHVVALRAVQTTDFMTADWAELPHALLARVSNRIINEVRGINRVVYDISSKPPATIEWE